jgi:hypothetical protein
MLLRTCLPHPIPLLQGKGIYFFIFSLLQGRGIYCFSLSYLYAPFGMKGAFARFLDA